MAKISRKNQRKMLEMFKGKLKHYKLKLKRNPGSLFYLGLVKNTKEYIEELKTEYAKMNNKENTSWVATFYDKNTKMLKQITYQNRTENEALREAESDVQHIKNVDDWTLMPESFWKKKKRR